MTPKKFCAICLEPLGKGKRKWPGLCLRCSRELDVELKSTDQR